MAWIAGAAAIGGALLSNMGASDRNEKQIASAREQMEFQERMSNTSYQRAVNDLSNAGLNPMLAYSQGGASTPSGSQANIEDTLTPAVNTGKEVYRSVTEAQVRSQQVDNIAADTGLKNAETEKAKSEATLNAARVDRERQETITSAASADLMSKHGQKVMEEIKKIAPEITQIISSANLNDAQRQRVLAELPLIAAQVPKVMAETEESYQRRLLHAAETRIVELKQNKQAFESEMYQRGGIGWKADMFHKGASVVPGLPWLYRKGE